MIRLVALALASLASAQSSLPGFTLTGTDWRYDPQDGGPVITGKLIQPTTGSAPFPAVLLSHGQNGNAAGFGVQKANVMRTWGFVCIAPNYTHVDTSYAPGSDGFSDENLRRAEACLTILASLGNVDMQRVAAYGNSKGAFLTIGLCGVHTTIRAAAITAGGTSGTLDKTLAAPSTAEAGGIVSPFLMLHGVLDTTVHPSLSASLQLLLAQNNVAHRREQWPSVGHNLHADRGAQVELCIRAWFSAHGVLGSGGNTPPTITTPPIQTLSVAAPSAPIAITVGDAQASAGTLTVSAFAFDGTLLPASGIAVGGSGANRTLSFTPSAAGATEVVVSVSDGEFVTAKSFPLLVGSGAAGVVCDPHSGATCPCGNMGADFRGCPHAFSPTGAATFGTGSTNPDTLVLAAFGMPVGTACMFLQGDAVGMVALGDGLLCASGSLVRLGVAFASGGSAATPTGNELPISIRGGVTPGSGVLRIYQAWYRDSTVGFCTVATHNLTSAMILVW